MMLCHDAARGNLCKEDNRLELVESNQRDTGQYTQHNGNT